MNTDAVSDPRVCEFPESDEDPVTKLPSTAASARTFPVQQDLARSEAPVYQQPDRHSRHLSSTDSTAIPTGYPQAVDVSVHEGALT